MAKSELLYDPSSIRTQNMPSDRSSDVWFDPDSSLTQQQFAKECDINEIVRKNEATGFLTHVNRSNPIWGADLGDSTDYHTASNYLLEANTSFMSLPAHVRAKFNNSPAMLLDFINDDRNYDEAVSLGLVDPSRTVNPNLPEPPPAPTPKRAIKPVEAPLEE